MIVRRRMPQILRREQIAAPQRLAHRPDKPAVHNDLFAGGKILRNKFMFRRNVRQQRVVAAHPISLPVARFGVLVRIELDAHQRRRSIGSARCKPNDKRDLPSRNLGRRRREVRRHGNSRICGIAVTAWCCPPIRARICAGLRMSSACNPNCHSHRQIENARSAARPSSA